MPFDFETIAGKLSGIAGALVSMRFLNGSIWERLTMAVGGATFSVYAAEYVAAKSSLPEGLAGFLLGLFGMSILSRAWEWFQTTQFDFSKWVPWTKRKETDE
jgi:hypothetical protein